MRLAVALWFARGCSDGSTEKVVQDRIIVRIILNRLSALSACG